MFQICNKVATVVNGKMVEKKEKKNILINIKKQTPNPPKQCSCRAQGDHNQVLEATAPVGLAMHLDGMDAIGFLKVTIQRVYTGHFPKLPLPK